MRGVQGGGWRWWVAVVVLVVATGTLVAATLGRVEYRPRADEGWYLRDAGVVRAEGPAGFRTLFGRFLDDAERQRYPNPLRLGYTGVAAGWTAAFGATFAALSWLSLAGHLATVTVTFALGRRALGDARALAVATLVATSPLLLGLARRALSDALATAAAATACWLFLALHRRCNARRVAAFVAALTFAALVRETALVLVVPCAAFALLERRRGRPAPSPGALAAALVLPPTVCGAAWLAAAGGVGPLVELARVLAGVSASNPYAVAYGSGPWHRYLVDFLLLAPAATVLGLAGLGVVLPRLVRGRGDGAGGAAALWILVGAGLLVALAGLTKNVRYAALLDVPLRLLAVLAVERLVPPWRRRRRALIGGAAVGLLAAEGVASWWRVFVAGGVYDPVTARLADALRLLPPAP